jgi:hypothetical protein
MHHSIWHEQDISRLPCQRRLAIDIVFNGAFEDVDNLFARMPVPGEGCTGREFDPQLPHFPAGDAEIMPL